MPGVFDISTPYETRAGGTGLTSFVLPLGMGIAGNRLERLGVRHMTGRSRGILADLFGGGALPGEMDARKAFSQRYYKGWARGGMGTARNDMSNRIIAKQRGRVLTGAQRMGTRFGAAGYAAKSVTRFLGAYQLMMFMPELGEAITGAVLDYRPRSFSKPQHEFGATFYDPRGAYTQRQRSLAAISDSALSSRAAFGNEASLMHGG